MLTKIIDFSIKNKLIIALFMLILIGYGVYQLAKLPIDAVPDITNNQVQVITVAPSYGATDIERLVTFPIEQANANIPGMVEIRSFSRFGLSIVTIVFDDETDVYWARQQVTERLQSVKSIIPKEIGEPQLGPITTGLGEIYQYVIRPKKGYENKYNETELRTVQDWIVRRQLLGVKGVAEVSSFGGKLKQYEIAVKPEQLNANNITIQDVFTALEKNNQNTGGAYIEKGPTVLYIRSEGLIGNKADIENISIKALNNGTPLRIRDIADVQIGNATRFGAMCYNAEGEVAGAVVMMLKGANSNEVIANIKERVTKIQKTLPEGLVIEPFLDRTKMVNNAIGTVEQNLMEGALIVVFILVLFLGNFRAGILVASVIPLAMLFAIILMNTFGVSGNLMSLGALDFGLIVDGAVIIVEAVMHQLTHNKKFNHIVSIHQKEMDWEVSQAAGKMMNSAVFGQIIILVVYLPIFTLQGIEGKMFKPMAQTVAFALIGAFILSLTYIPMMSAVFLSKKIKHKKNISDLLMEKTENVYLRFLEKIIRYPKSVIGIVITMFAIAILILTQLGGEFIPALEEGDFAVETRVLVGSSLNTSIENTQKASKILLEKFPEVQKVVTKIGSGEVPTDPMPMDAADLMVILKDKKEWTSASTFNELAEKMGEALSVVPGVTFSFQYPVQMRFNELMTGAKQDVVCKIFGENLDTLANLAQKLGNIAARIDGAKDLYVEAVTGMPQVIIDYNRSALAQYNLSISEVNSAVNTAFAGKSSGMVFEGERRFDLVVRLNTDKRKNLDDIKNLLISSPSGVQIPLYQLANVEIKDGPNQIQREDAKRRIIIGFNVRGRDVESIVNELQEKVGKNIKFPAGYYPTYGGTFENLNAAKKRLSIAVPVSLILIFLLLYFAFNSIKHGLLIYSAIPLSAIGGIYALGLRDMPFSISAGIGFIALFGVAVLNGIVLIAEFNRIKDSGSDELKEVVMKGTKLRLRPVLMTAFVASLGFFPMAVSNGAGAEVQRPLATVVIGGLLVATLLTLFVLPILYIAFEKRNKKKKISTTNTVLFLFFIGISASQAQTKINLTAAIDSALKNNLAIKNEKLKAEYKEKIIKTAFTVPQTTVAVGYGQINSSFYDNQINIGQSFNFPGVYTKQKDLYREQWKSSILNVAVKEAELKRDVSLIFNYILILTKKQELLMRIDSLYAEQSKKLELRLKLGEISGLDNASTEAQRIQIISQLNNLKQELEISLLEFNLMLNAQAVYTPEFASNIKLAKSELDSSAINNHPLAKLYLQEKNVSLFDYKLEKRKLLPEINVSYNNMSMKGNGADNVYYTGGTRFQSAQIGVGIPLFYGAQKNKIKSSFVQTQIAQTAYEIQIQQLKKEFSTLRLKLNKSSETLMYIEEKGLKHAKTIDETATKKLENGDINYIEWTILNNQSNAIKDEYLNALKTYNETIIQLNYLINK